MTTLDKQSEIKKRMNGHFSDVAKYYRYLRTTDLTPIYSIKKNIVGRELTCAADIGCGAGRYSFHLLRHLNIGHLLCIDASENMLKANGKYLSTKGMHNYSLIISSAESIPLVSATLDYVFTFNAIHHFNAEVFFQEAARILKTGGKIFVYTRLKSQNKTNVWGMYFPSFLEKENRLYGRVELESAIKRTEGIYLESLEEFRFKRKSSLTGLKNRARLKHYSTFSLYEDDEFEQALRLFADNISKQFTNLKNITWFDEYTMFIIKNII